MSPLNYVSPALSLGAVILALATVWTTKGSYLTMARVQDLLAETWKQLEHHDDAAECRARAVKFRRSAWPRRERVTR